MDTIRLLWKKVDEIESIQDVTKRDIELKKIVASVDKNKIDSSEGNYLKGYCLYNLSNWTDEIKNQIRCLLSDVGKTSRSYWWARQYLAYYFFDEKNYKTSLRELEKLGGFHELKNNQYWRYLKNQELILCCKIYLGLNEKEKMQEFFDEYASSDDFERAKLTELSNCYMSINKTEKMDANELKKLKIFIDKYN
ncbi:hypothetical protein [Aliikangiella maris]|uniref:Uncharacterized protein n=2 Tax=Aliikangiella maris TaxID=3162458 RepID=A0ABV3MUZ1_9GAMM